MNRKSYRALVLLLLTIVYGFNFIDRQIVGILAPFIQADLGLTNTQLGLLIGLAFAVLYTTVAIPIAWLADKYNRVNILSIALATWSGFTALTGLANNFLQTIFVTKWVKTGNMTVKTQNSRDKLMTNYFLSLCNPLFIRVSKYSTIEWE